MKKMHRMILLALICLNGAKLTAQSNFGVGVSTPIMNFQSLESRSLPDGSGEFTQHGFRVSPSLIFQAGLKNNWFLRLRLGVSVDGYSSTGTDALANGVTTEEYDSRSHTLSLYPGFGREWIKGKWSVRVGAEMGFAYSRAKNFRSDTDDFFSQGKVIQTNENTTKTTLPTISPGCFVAGQLRIWKQLSLSVEMPIVLSVEKLKTENFFSTVEYTGQGNLVSSQSSFSRENSWRFSLYYGISSTRLQLFWNF